MPESWSKRQIKRLLGSELAHPLTTTRTHVAWQNPALRVEHNLVLNAATSREDFAVRIAPTSEPFYAAVIVPLARDGRLHLLARYRYAISRWSIELPRFDFDSSDAGWKEAAEADLRHTAGLSAKTMHLLGSIQIDPSLISTSTIVILAESCSHARSKARSNPLSAARVAELELIAGSLAVPWADVPALIENGEIVCGVTLAALSLYRAWLR